MNTYTVAVERADDSIIIYRGPDKELAMKAFQTVGAALCAFQSPAKVIMVGPDIHFQTA